MQRRDLLTGAVGLAVSLAVRGQVVPARPLGVGFGYSTAPAAATPTFSPSAGSYSSTQTVTISCSTSGATIYYTTDGSTPTTSSTVYTTALTVSSTTTVKAIATAAGYMQSAVGTAVYTISGGGGTFDYYIATTGSDSNSGTSISSPWAITGINTKASTYAGKRVGIMPGTYDVSSLMFAASGGNHSPALMINGGPNSSTLTYIGTCDSSGNYLAGTATLDAKGSSGFYGGSNSNSSTIIGGAQGYSPGPATPANWGNWTLDGIILTGWSAWCIQVGSYDGGGGAMPNCTIQNCQFVNSNGSFTTIGIDSTHGGCMVLYSYTNCIINNCLFQNIINTGGNATHWDAITGMGYNTSSGLTIEYCSFITAAGFYGIQDNGYSYSTTIQYCYFDVTANSGIPNTQAIALGLNSNTGHPSNSFHHNIVRGGSAYDNMGLQAYPNAQQFFYYNNTWDRAGGSGANSTGMMRCLEETGSTGLITAYNNLVYDNGAGSISYGYMTANTDGFALCDYNIYGTAADFATCAANGGTTPTGRTFSAWQTAIGGLDTHSSTSATNPFTNGGANALQYLISSGSTAYQTGRVGGTSGGAVCNVGAWDGTVTQIGFVA